jgi:hypothetical protein
VPAEHAPSVASGTGARTSRTRKGPRHAAPRKSLLTKLQVPAGKAIAIAAMPTAVLMGMGLTPRLALAGELPRNPFSGTSCADETPDPDPTPDPDATPPSPPSRPGSPGGEHTGTHPGTSGGPGSTDSRFHNPAVPGGTGGGNGEHTAPPSPSPSASDNADPRDPLGIGDALNDLLNGGGQDSPPFSLPPSLSNATPKASPDIALPPAPDRKSARKAIEDTAEAVHKIGRTVQENVEKTTDKLRDSVSTTGGTADKAVPKTPASPGHPRPAGSGGHPYPCPTPDAKALAGAEYERTPSLLPDDPWILKTDLLTLTGLKYHGVVKVRTFHGTVKSVLKFTATGVDIKNLHQITNGPDGEKYHVQARAGSTSTIRNGTVTMYTESLKGKLFGTIPITFTPETPPPLDVPAAFFSDVMVVQAGQFGGTLTIPGMHLFRSGG